MQLARPWKPSLQQAVHSFPVQPMLLAPAHQLMSPVAAESFPKHPETIEIARYRVKVEVTLHDRLEPLSRFRHQFMPALRQLPLNGLQLGWQALGNCLTPYRELALTSLPTNVGKA